MKNTYIFSDWTSVNQIVNSVNPKIKAQASAILEYDEDDTTPPKIIGHDLTVYIGNAPSFVILYKVKIDMDVENTWSITTEDAVSMMNALGFICKYQYPEYGGMLSKDQHDILTSLINLGYTHIIRSLIDGRGNVTAINLENPEQVLSLRDTKGYNYQDWLFLDTDNFVNIEALIKENELP